MSGRTPQPHNEPCPARTLPLTPPAPIHAAPASWKPVLITDPTGQNPAAHRGFHPTPPPLGASLITCQNPSCFLWTPPPPTPRGSVRTLALTLDYSWAAEIRSSLNEILFCKHSKLRLSSGPFQVLFPLLEMLFPKLYAGRPPS